MWGLFLDLHSWAEAVMTGISNQTAGRGQTPRAETVPIYGCVHTLDRCGAVRNHGENTERQHQRHSIM